LRPIPWKLVIVLGVIAISAVLVAPTFNSKLWPYKKINLGLDLQGGMHLMLQVDTDKAVENKTDTIITDLRSSLKKERIRYSLVSKKSFKEIIVKIKGVNNFGKFNNFAKNNLNNFSIADTKLDGDKKIFTLKFKDKNLQYTKKMAIDQALETIRGRIDQFGVSEPDIRKQGEDRILIELPGIKDTERAKNLIGKTAQLSFKLVDDKHSLEDALKNGPLPGSEVLYEMPKGGGSKTPVLLKKRTLLSGEYLTDARVSIDSQYNRPYVSIEFNKKGARLFEKITGQHIHKRLAIVLDNQVYSAPVIQDRIAGGRAQITGSFTMEEARDLAIVLRAGALPAPVNIVEERTVGPTLGADSIRKGLISMAVGGVLVIIFMVIYYSMAGLIADLALVVNILMIGAGLAIFQATLTLPGIAGIILTIGMAVDANVLIYERIREELRIGVSVVKAIENGFAQATLTILDANVTTLIAAIVLFQFGTGPVKGFAVTLTLGILSSLFTALFVSKIIFENLYIGKGNKKLYI